VDTSTVGIAGVILHSFVWGLTWMVRGGAVHENLAHKKIPTPLGLPWEPRAQGYLAHEKTPPRRTLQWDHA